MKCNHKHTSSKPTFIQVLIMIAALLLFTSPLGFLLGGMLLDNIFHLGEQSSLIIVTVIFLVIVFSFLEYQKRKEDEELLK